MPNFNTAIKTAQSEAAYKRNVEPSFRGLQGVLRTARFPYTFAGTEANADTITLGALGLAGYVVPELSRIRDTGGAQDIDVSVKLNALIGGTTSTDLSGTVAFDNAAIAFTEIAGTDLVLVGATDDLRLVINDGAIGAVTAGETVVVEVAYISEEAL